MPFAMRITKQAQHFLIYAQHNVSKYSKSYADRIHKCKSMCVCAFVARNTTHQQLSAFLFNFICLLPDMSQVLLHNVLMLIVQAQAKRMYVFTCCAVFRDDSGCALADVVSPQHWYAHVVVCQGFIVSQCKHWLSRVFGLTDKNSAVEAMT